jgi:hypothetical protein
LRSFKEAIMSGVWVLGLALFATTAWADPKAEVKAGTGVENREIVGAADKFKSGDTVFVWSSVTDADGEKVQHVWKLDGKEVFKVGFDVKSKRWRTNSRRQKAQKGAWVVEVQKEDGSKLGEVAFTVE